MTISAKSKEIPYKNIKSIRMLNFKKEMEENKLKKKLEDFKASHKNQK